MKIAIASDIHLEFGTVELKGDFESDVLILAGDICPIHNQKILKDFLDFYTNIFKDIIWIAGNHEYYLSEYFNAQKTIKNFVKRYKNVHFLDNDSITIGNANFFGGTLWTTCNNHHPFTDIYLRKYMSDFAGAIKFGKRNFLPEDSYHLHKATMKKLFEWYPKNTTLNNVVITHHLPHEQSIPDEFKNDWDANGGFRTDLDNFIADHPNINLWIHGHTHQAADYQVHQTRIVCNPRGYYGKEHKEIDFQLKEIILLDKC